MDRILNAINLADSAHRTQKRKYTGEPYFVHLAEVAAITSTVTNDYDMIAAAYLHDVLEDTDTGPDMIERYCGMTVVVFVEWLTDVPTTIGNRAFRKECDRNRLSSAPPEVQTIKYADLISNTRSIVPHDPNFAKIYLEEKRLLLEVMNRGDASLYALACSLSKEQS